MQSYISNTIDQQKEMLIQMGVVEMKDLFTDIPDRVRLKRDLNLPTSLSEMEIMSHLQELAGKNCNTDENVCFLGAGAYDHYIPSVVGHLTSRQEFYTAYTPYQPEISQGTLQAIFEYQTMICHLTGMEVANASMYDGATALAEAAAMACQATRRKEILVARSVHPESREVLHTYSKFNESQVIEFGYKDGRIDLEELEGKIGSSTAAVILQTPNFFGIIEGLKAAAEITHRHKALFIVSCDPIALALLKSPGEQGADIVVGEGQCLGNTLSFGGPYLGFFAATKELMRRMPGRIVGETTDKNGKGGFVLTIQTREQHIRREKATSNICSNQALNALTATIYLSTLGKHGLRHVANLCLQKAHYTHEQLIKTGLFQPVFGDPFLKEFALKFSGDVGQLNKKLLKERIIGGYDLGKVYPELENCWLLAVTEKRTKSDIDALVKAVKEC